MDRDLKPFLPPITPEGVFKTEFHFYTKEKNYTLIDLTTFTENHHIGLSDFKSLDEIDKSSPNGRSSNITSITNMQYHFNC